MEIGTLRLRFGFVFILYFVTCSFSGNCENLSKEGRCSKKGFFRDKDDCAKFYRCIEKPIISNHDDSRLGLERHEFTCPPGTLFDAKINTCNYPDRIKFDPDECQVTNNPIRTPDCQLHAVQGQPHFTHPNFYALPPFVHYPFHHPLPQFYVHHPIVHYPIPYVFHWI